jgi:hypothetical protein
MVPLARALGGHGLNASNKPATYPRNPLWGACLRPPLAR